MSWLEIKGHDVQRLALVRAIQRGRLGHAYLFVGPPGIGKRSLAVELACSLFCANTGADLQACGRCESCTLMAAGNHPDFFAVARSEEKNELTIDVMLELCRALSLKPARGRGKIALLDNADDLNAESSNAFLKTLEEPPPGSVFFLIGTSTERQLPTLVSRCQVVRFAPLSDEGTADILRRQGISDDRTLNRLVRLARGSPGQALALAEAALWEFRQVLLDGLLQPSPDSATLSKRWVEFVEENGKDGPAQRRLATLVIRLLLEFFDDALSVRLGGTPRLGDPEELVNLRKLADRAEPDMLLKLLDRCLEADVQAGRYVQLVLVQEALLDALAALLATT